jgi:hypothetical protein
MGNFNTITKLSPKHGYELGFASSFGDARAVLFSRLESHFDDHFQFRCYYVRERQYDPRNEIIVESDGISWLIHMRLTPTYMEEFILENYTITYRERDDAGARKQDAA